MSKIIAIGTAVPQYRHNQEEILCFMQRIYATNSAEQRKMRFLYHQGGIAFRHSVIADYSRPAQEWKFYPRTENLEPFPSLEQRMAVYNRYAAPLSVDAIRNCIKHTISSGEITHLITVSCTGMSAPGLDLQVMNLMELPNTIFRTSVNFMGCYAAIHALKLADAICNNDTGAKVMIVCTELCTLHFQREATIDNITSAMLFADGSAAALVTHNDFPVTGLKIENFYSEVIPKGRKDMAWELSSTGFLMTLSGYIPDLIEEDFEAVVERSLKRTGKHKTSVNHWCIHPGGKRILDTVSKSLGLDYIALEHSYQVLQQFGNMSSPTILFVLKQLLDAHPAAGETLLAAAFGPGLTMETFTATIQG